MLWHPTPLRDPALIGDTAVWTCACDPGRPSGVAILHCGMTGEVHAATAALKFGAHPTPSREVREAVGAALDLPRMVGPWRLAPGVWRGDPRAEHWECACEDVGDVYERPGTDHATAQAKRRALMREAMLAGQLRAAVSEVVSVRGEAVYESKVWRAVIGAAGARKDLAKALAVAFVENHFGATVSDHEAEACCIGLHHLRCLRIGDRRAQAPLGLELAAKKRGGKRSLPAHVLDKMGEDDRRNAQNRPSKPPEGAIGR